MSAAELIWSDELAVQHPRMDATHQEFVTHVQRVQGALVTLKAECSPPEAVGTMATEGAATDAKGATEPGPTRVSVSDDTFHALVARLDELIDHTVDHFDQEDRWMVATGFAPENCHSTQHTQVLELLKEVRHRLVDLHQLEWLDRLMPELVEWFIGHAQGADAALAYHMDKVGYDTDSGVMREPLVTAAAEEALTAPALIGGCGDTASCGH